MTSVDRIRMERLCTKLCENGTTKRRDAIKEILEIAGKESNRAALSVMGAG